MSKKKSSGTGLVFDDDTSDSDDDIDAFRWLVNLEIFLVVFNIFFIQEWCTRYIYIQEIYILHLMFIVHFERNLDLNNNNKNQIVYVCSTF